MKIGIITYHFVENYGAVFQVTALQTVLTKLNHDVEIINYLPEHQRKFGSLKYQKITLKNIYKRCLFLGWCVPTLGQRHKRREYFAQYRSKYLHLSQNTYLNSNELVMNKPSYDFFIAGSDQIWSPKLTGGQLDPAYFLAFAKKPACCASYAASMGTSNLESDYVPQFKELIENIGHISVREASSIQFIEQKSGNNVACVLDPTLLLKKETWSKFSQKPNDVSEKYLLIFTLLPDTSLLSLGKRIAEMLHIPIIQIGLVYRNHVPLLFYPRPEEWLWYFANASFIITNSFHGTVFSIINNKPFYSILSNPKKTRIIDLLTPLGLLDRFSETGNAITTIIIDIDYDPVMEILEKLRSRSLVWLKETLKEESCQQ